MADSLIEALNTLKRKIELNNQRYMALKDECERLKTDNDSLRHELSLRDHEIERLSKDAEFLTYSHRLADSPDAIVKTRRHIARLIRNIDTCIALLKE